MKRGQAYHFLFASGWGAFLGYLLIFLIFFLQFPLQNSLSGDLDVIGNLAQYKELVSLVSGGAHSVSNYPMMDSWVAFGADFGLGILHLFFNALGFNDLWANWLFNSVLFALNSLGIYLLVFYLVKYRFAALIAGLLFSSCQFTLANMENPNTLFFLFFLLSLLFYLRSVDEKNIRLFYLAVILGSFQIYFSPYVFVLYCISFSIIVLFREYSPRTTIPFFLKYIPAILLGSVIISPFLYLYVFNNETKSFLNPIIDFDYTHVCSLNLNDLGRVLPNHLLFSPAGELGEYLSKVKSAYVGLSFWALAILGVFVSGKSNSRLFLPVFIGGLLLSIGPYVSWNSAKMFPSLLWPLFEYSSLDSFLRLPFRAFFICIIVMTVFSGFAIKHLMSKRGWGKYLVAFFGLIFFIENVPQPLIAYDHGYVLKPDNTFINVLKAKPPGTQIVAHFPSKLFSFHGDQREYIYMYWKSFHQQNIINGSLAYFPPERMRNDSLMGNWHDGDNLELLVRENGINYIVYHKDLNMDDIRDDNPDFLRSWDNYPFLSKIDESDRTLLLGVH